MWNKTLLKQDIKNDTRILRQLKELRSESHQPRFGWQARRDLADAKRRATIHHACAASMRGKIHLTNWQPKEGPRRPMTAEEQRALIEKVLSQYVLPDPVALAATQDTGRESVSFA